MEEKNSHLSLFLISILIMIGVVILLWPYFLEILAYIGVFIFALFILIFIVGIAVLITHLILIPFFALNHPAEISGGNYSIDDAKEPGKDEKD